MKKNVSGCFFSEQSVYAFFSRNQSSLINTVFVLDVMWLSEWNNFTVVWKLVDFGINVGLMWRHLWNQFEVNVTWKLVGGEWTVRNSVDQILKYSAIQCWCLKPTACHLIAGGWGLHGVSLEWSEQFLSSVWDNGLLFSIISDSGDTLTYIQVTLALLLLRLTSDTSVAS